MNFPNVPNRLDHALLVIGSFFIAIGIIYSNIWAIFWGIILTELGVLLIVFIFIGTVFFDKNTRDRTQRDFVYSYFIISIFILFITIVILSKLYFNFDLLHEIAQYFNVFKK